MEEHTEEEIQPIFMRPSTELSVPNESMNEEDMKLALPDVGPMDRARSDPLALQSSTSSNRKRNDTDDEKAGTASFLTPKSGSRFMKKWRSQNDILDSARSDFPGFDVRQPSVETLSLKTARLRPYKKQQVVVPARDHLVKIPFHSTPLTVEATNNAFFDFVERLSAMDLGDQAEAALVHTQCEGVEAAVDFIFRNEAAIFHRFKPPNKEGPNKEGPLLQSAADGDTARDLESGGGAESADCGSPLLCLECGELFDRHLIDADGVKIAIGVSEDNYNEQGALEEVVVEQPPAIRSVSSLAPELAIGGQMGSAADDEDTKQCVICFLEKPLREFPEAAECGHNDYCNDCLTEHYKTKTADGDVLKVKCIDPKCEREIKEEEILQFLTDDAIREKFVRFKRQKLLMLDENARFCPTADCEGFMIGSRMRPKLQCPDCHTVICFNCSKPWHGYFSKCASAQRAAETENDEKYYQWEMNKDVKKCPKCKMRIEKNAGCNHMTCQSCKYEFCWICKGKYSSGHFSDYNLFGCPGGQYNTRSIGTCCGLCSCFPAWVRRLCILVMLVLISPIFVAIGCVLGLGWGCIVFCVAGAVLSICD